MNKNEKHNVVRNTKFALEGLVTTWKDERSFRIQVVIGLILLPIVYFLDFSLWQKMVLLVTAFIILIVELVNTAVENVVDLVTKDFEPLAKRAKDIAAGAAFLSIVLHGICWIIFLFFT